MTRVVGEQQTLAWFVEAFDKEDPCNVHLITSEGHWEQRRRFLLWIYFRSAWKFSVWIFDNPKHPHPNVQISGLGASQAHSCQKRTDTH